jgi:integrase
MTKALTAKRIENSQPGANRQEIPDGLLVGLYLVVQPSGAKSFAVRYRHAGQPRKLTLGAFPALNLEAAREIGAKALRAAAEGRDPATEKQAAKGQAKKADADAARTRRDLFENVAREFIERHAMKSNKPTTWRETARILGLRPSRDDPTVLLDVGGDVMPAWRGRRIQDISKRDVITLLDSVNDRGSPIMANRVLSAVRKLFNWCVARDVIQVSPCTLVTPPAPERSRDRILDDAEIKLVWNAADAEGWPFGPLVKLLVLTGQRLTEVSGMRWDEFDLEKKLWTLPAERVKNGERHEVPLSDAAIAILTALPRIKTTKGVVFTTRRDAAVSGFSRAKDRLDAGIAAAVTDGPPVGHWTFHDLRRTMASGMARLGIQLPVIEKVLNHTSGTFRGVVGVYQRHSFSDEKRKALDSWASFVQSLVLSQSLENIVSIRGRG